MENGQGISQLLEKARSGDEAARNALFEKCRNYLTFVARARTESWLQTRVDLSDIVQQTMLEAHRGLEGFRGQSEGQWLGWLKQILVHNVADLARRFQGVATRDARGEVQLDALKWGDNRGASREPPAAGPTPSEVVMQYERQLQLADAMARLSPDHQEVIQFRNLQYMPFDEIARRMGRSRPAVQMLWMRAIRSLQREMKDVPS